MSNHSFNTYKEAAAFARAHKGTVRRSADGFDVSLSKVSVGVKPKPEEIQPPLQVKPTDAQKPPKRTVSAKFRLCIDCGDPIPASRVATTPNVSRCIKCQSEFERKHDTRPHINEGLAGTREANKKIRGWR